MVLIYLPQTWSGDYFWGLKIIRSRQISVRMSAFECRIESTSSLLFPDSKRNLFLSLRECSAVSRYHVFLLFFSLTSFTNFSSSPIFESMISKISSIPFCVSLNLLGLSMTLYSRDVTGRFILDWCNLTCPSSYPVNYKNPLLPSLLSISNSKIRFL